MDKSQYMLKPSSYDGSFVVYDLSLPKGEGRFGDDDASQMVGVWHTKRAIETKNKKNGSFSDATPETFKKLFKLGLEQPSQPVIKESSNNDNEATKLKIAIKSELEQKGLKGFDGGGVIVDGADEILNRQNNIQFFIQLVTYAWGKGVSVYFMNTPENQQIAKEVYKKYGGAYSQGFKNGKVIGVYTIGYKEATQQQPAQPQA